MRDGSMAGFKYFDLDGCGKIGLTVRGDAGCFEIRLAENAAPAAVIPVEAAGAWHTVWAALKSASGVCPVYITRRGEGTSDFLTLHFA